MNCEGINQNTKVQVKVEVSSKDVIIMPDESAEMKIDLNLLVDIFKNTEMNVITDLNVEENREIDNYSIIIYFVKPGDTLWKIAKNLEVLLKILLKLMK